MEEKNEGITSQEYLDLTNQAKELVDKAEKKLAKVKNENNELRKTIITAYGFVRMVSIWIDQCEPDDLPYEVDNMVEILRSYLSEIVECNFSQSQAD